MLPVYDNSIKEEIQYSSKKMYHVSAKRQNQTVGVTIPQRQQAEKTDSEKQGEKTKRDDFEVPVCLNSKFKALQKRDCINNWGITDNATRATLLEQYRRNKKASHDGRKKDSGSIGRISYTPTSTHSTIFKALFAKVTVEPDLMGDQGVDANYISV